MQPHSEFGEQEKNADHFNSTPPPKWVAVCGVRCGNLSETPEGCRSARFMTTTHTTSPPILRIATLLAMGILQMPVAVC